MDIGMSELLIIGIVALVVIGPRDLPEMFRQLGRMTAKMRSMAREFNRAMEQAAKETGVQDITKDLKAMTSPSSLGLNAVKGAMDKFEKWDPIKNAAKPAVAVKPPLVPPSMPATPVVAVAVAEPVILPPVSATVVSPAHGPNTAALFERKAAREAIMAESAAKLKALDEAPLVVAEVKPPARRTKADPAAEVAAEATPVVRAPRKKKVAEE